MDNIKETIKTMEETLKEVKEELIAKGISEEKADAYVNFRKEIWNFPYTKDILVESFEKCGVDDYSKFRVVDIRGNKFYYDITDGDIGERIIKEFSECEDDDEVSKEDRCACFVQEMGGELVVV